MLNKKPTHNRSHWKFGIIVPLLLLFVFSFNVKTEAQITGKENSLSVVINKESEEENLEKLVSHFDNNEIELKFENVQRNSEGNITNIEVYAQNENTPEEKGWFRLNDPKGISTFQIAVKDGKIAFSDEVDVTTQERMDFLSGIGENPLFIIGQKEYSSEELEGKIVRLTKTPSVLTGEDAAKYGTKAKDGVIIDPNGEIKDYSAGLKELDAEGEAKNNYILITGDSKPMYLRLGKEFKVSHSETNADTGNINVLKSTVRVITSSDQEDPVVYVDGKKMEEKFDSNLIDFEKIATINVQKSSQPGERSKVVIVTKEFAKNTDQKGKTTATNASVRVTTSSDQEDPIIYVDGKKMEEKFDSNSIDPDKIATINVQKASQSGERSKVVIVTKEFAEKSAQKAETDGKIIVKKSSDEGTTVEIRGVSGHETPIIDALYVVDGKVMGKDFDPNSIEAKNIESIHVLKGDSATEKYGKKARKGVIEIQLKD